MWSKQPPRNNRAEITQDSSSDPVLFVNEMHTLFDGRQVDDSTLLIREDRYR